MQSVKLLQSRLGLRGIKSGESRIERQLHKGHHRGQ